MPINDVIALDVEGDVAVIIANSPPVNALSAAVRDGLVKAFTEAIGDAGVQAIVLICEGRTFFAGADITEFGKPPQPPSLPDVLDIIENAPKPVIAAIHGTALGGGLETALVHHYRIAAKSAKCGLPEVKLGLLAGAGGTQRLPRLVGVPKALEMITAGNPISAQEAFELGLVDALAEDGQLRAEAVAFARRIVAEGSPLRRVRDIDDKLASTRGTNVVDEFRRKNAKRFRNMLAPEYNMRCIEAALSLPFDDAIAEERRLFQELMAGPQSAAQRHVFFAERQAAKVEGIASVTPVRPVASVGIVGAGTMGAGIAMAFRNAGLPVVLVDTAETGLARGLSTIRKQCEADAAKGRITAIEAEARLNGVRGTLELEDLRDCDLVIEAVFELIDIKRKVMARIDDVAKPGAILATNTSYLDVDEIASVTKRPESVVGMHFFSPANIMRLVEVVRAKATAPDVIATCLSLAKRLGKVGVVAGVCHGFIGNRILAQRQRQAERLVLEGALPWDVDRVLYDFGFPMGPFSMRDLAGLDLGWDRAKSNSSTIVEILNEMGRHGQKSGMGFYDYDANRVATPSPIVEQVIREFAERQGMRQRKISDEEILQRCLYPMVNEGARILDEGIAQRASDIDVVWLMGYGWPAYRGGPMYWAEQEGLPRILERMRTLERNHGEDFRPAPLLERLVEEGKGFSAFKRSNQLETQQ